jgi:E3 ubiquitin-protein ligase HUWE1
MRFYSLNTLPYDLSNTSAFFTLSHLIKLLAETTPSVSIIAVVEEVQKHLDVVEPLLQSVNPESDLLKYLDISSKISHTIRISSNLSSCTSILTKMCLS